MFSGAGPIIDKKLATLRRDGIVKILKRRYEVKKRHWQLDSWLAGKYVELVKGNNVEFAGLKFSLDNPTIRTREKSALYFGRHETGEISLARSHLPRNLPIVEFGGSIGVVSCVTNKLLDNSQLHVVVEANTRLIPTLTRNRDMNGCKFKIINAALAYGTPTISFAINSYFLCGSLFGEGVDKITIPTISLGQILREHGFGRITLVVDVEGAEAQLVANEIDIIATHVDTLLLETHPGVVGKPQTEQMLDALRGRGFRQLGDADNGGIVLLRSGRE